MMRRISRIVMHAKWFRLSFIAIWYFLVASILSCDAKAEQKISLLALVRSKKRNSRNTGTKERQR